MSTQLHLQALVYAPCSTHDVGSAVKWYNITTQNDSLYCCWRSVEDPNSEVQGHALRVQPGMVHEGLVGEVLMEQSQARREVGLLLSVYGHSVLEQVLHSSL